MLIVNDHGDIIGTKTPQEAYADFKHMSNKGSRQDFLHLLHNQQTNHATNATQSQQSIFQESKINDQISVRTGQMLDRQQYSTDLPMPKTKENTAEGLKQESYGDRRRQSMPQAASQFDLFEKAPSESER